MQQTASVGLFSEAEIKTAHGIIFLPKSNMIRFSLNLMKLNFVNSSSYDVLLFEESL